MSFFVLEYRYADLEARARVRPDHLAYLKSLQQEGTVVLAGPVGDGSGAMMVLQAGSEEEARRIVRDDPYTAAGVGVDHVLRPWNVVVPTQSG
ncbi:MAG TPA: YciI family protein [Dermatophilaceae bacterium]|nr:YciI family protein [Dermatophilaceae bacterium]